MAMPDRIFEDLRQKGRYVKEREIRRVPQTKLYKCNVW